MNATTRTGRTSHEQLPKEILQLATEIAALPELHRQRIEPVLCRVLESSQRRQRILSLVQEALSQLRLDMKYLLFDLEATRRERDACRRRGADPSE